MDISKHREIAFSPPDISELEINKIVDILKSGWITTGPETKRFERMIADYIGVHKAVCLNSDTAAMELTLRILGVGPGDEVITSAYTYTASASVIHHVGAKIILVDVSEDSYEMDYEQLANAITHRTKVIIPVDIAGVMCDYGTLYEILERKKELYTPSNRLQKLFDRVIVIEDAAHALGRQELGKVWASSRFYLLFFSCCKNLTTAEGGAVVWKNNSKIDDEELYQQYMLYSLHGQSKSALTKAKKRHMGI